MRLNLYCARWEIKSYFKKNSKFLFFCLPYNFFSSLSLFFFGFFSNNYFKYLLPYFIILFMENMKSIKSCLFYSISNILIFIFHFDLNQLYYLNQFYKMKKKSFVLPTKCGQNLTKMTFYLYYFIFLNIFIILILIPLTKE